MLSFRDFLNSNAAEKEHQPTADHEYKKLKSLLDARYGIRYSSRKIKLVKTSFDTIESYRSGRLSTDPKNFVMLACCSDKDYYALEIDDKAGVVLPSSLTHMNSSFRLLRNENQIYDFIKNHKIKQVYALYQRQIPHNI